MCKSNLYFCTRTSCCGRKANSARGVRILCTSKTSFSVGPVERFAGIKEVRLELFVVFARKGCSRDCRRGGASQLGQEKNSLGVYVY